MCSVLIHSTSWKLFWWKDVICPDTGTGAGLNPFYIMETILIKKIRRKIVEKNRVLIHSTSWKLFWCKSNWNPGKNWVECLNPFYIMETILIIVTISVSVPVPWVLIHSTSWKLFWCDHPNLEKRAKREVLIHSTSWKLFWWIEKNFKIIHLVSLNPFYIMETILIC